LALTPGTHLGVYEITAQIGAGGMGEVYRATDSNLKRSVAIKVLPASVAGDADRLARFQREAEVLAALNHPNIAAIYGLEKTPDFTALVMELVEGEDLSQRIARGAVPIDEALPIAKQIAEALEAAHEQGIIHRDLKPANIKVRADGTVKVLDFGLAKALEPAAGSSSSLSMSPTLSLHATQAGIILGTAAYMSPEQARGKAVDRRVDIWAFGAVLFEMLTGTRAFGDEDVSMTLSKVLQREPNFDALALSVPARVSQTLRLCLRKDPKQRVGDIRDVRLALEGAFETTVFPTAIDAATTVRKTPSISLRVWQAVASLFALMAVAGATAWWSASRSTTPSVTRFFVYPAEKTSFATGVTFGRPSTSVTISPDGSKLAFTARDPSGKILLWVRPLDSLTAQPLPSTDDAAFPFWSPDSRFIGYFAQQKLLKIAAGGGPPQTLCDTGISYNRGGTWGQAGTIVFSTGLGRTLSRVSSAGGQPSEFLRLVKGQSYFSGPWFLPDGRHFLFYAAAASYDVAGLYVGSLDASAESKRLTGADSAAVYDSQSGHLLFLRQETLLAQLFDPTTLVLRGESFTVAERVEAGAVPGIAAFSVSNNGILAYGVGAAEASAGLSMAWFDRQGQEVEAVGPVGNYRGIDLAPDGTHVAAHRHDGNGGDIWVTDLARSTTSRFTFDASQENTSPIWSPDATHIVYGSTRNGKSGLYQKKADNAGSEERLVESNDTPLPVSWSPDGNSIVYLVTGPGTNGDLWVLPLSGDRKPFPLLHTPFAESHAQISPDGKWFAYQSNETGRMEVYVQPFPSRSGKWQVSTNGGYFPRWRRDGHELFYMSQTSAGRMMAVDVKSSGSTFEAGAPRDLFDSPYTNLSHVGGGRYHPYAVSADGKRFLIPYPQSSDAAKLTMPIAVVENWAAARNK
jgi:serine/threonine protein kinase/WD40 repeat protein